MDKTLKNDKEPNFGQMLAHLAQIWATNSFLQVLLLLVIKHCSKLSSNAIIKETNEPNLR